MKFCVFFGSLRDDRLGLVAAKYIMQLLKARKHETFLFDPLGLQFPTMSKADDHRTDPAILPDARHHVFSADGFFAVSAEYNHSMPPTLTNAFDHFSPADYQRKVCGIVTYSVGHFGGLTAAIQLRSFLGVLGMATPGYMFHIPKIDEAFTASGAPKNELVRRGGERIVQEVEWHAETLRNQSYKTGNPAIGTKL